ncbi:PREDICTED: FT-interacting protein 1-like [Camelina sativa]|uniref:FT-interacting protein 1-like n=1 Tax=Camelina sativa TaxID=90675 RepID=A0ABM0WNT7_CAMSA|nr:PREDICTED: FT-interacting protein 1-like [Camelina sativa]
MSNLKLGVEVISARLKPRDDYGGVNAFVELRFDDQKVKSSTKIDDSSPVWNEKFFFNISETEDLSNLFLEAYVYNKTSSITKSCLGKIRILGTAFLPYSEAVGWPYPLEKEKWSMFSFAAASGGELALKVFVTDNPSPKVPNLIPPTPKKIPSKTRHRVHNIPKTEKSKSSPREDQKPSQQQPSEPQRPQPPPAMESSRFQEPRLGPPVPTTMGFNPNPPDYSIKQTNPVLGGGRRARPSAHDLVEPMEFLFIKIVKARDLPRMDPTGSLDPYIEVKLGNFNAVNKSSLRSKVYHSPRLWYLRVNVIEAQDLVIVPDRFPNPYVKIKLGNQVVRTKPSHSLNPRWNEEFTLVAAEPFEDLIVSIKDRVAVNREESLGEVHIPFGSISRRIDDNRTVPDQWFSLKSENQRRVRFATTRLHLNVCLEGGYHVLDESTYYSSDFRPSMKELLSHKQPSIGVLELGILRIEGLNLSQEAGKKETVDAYCVAKYGTKWVRTRTITNCFNPRFNEQYTWEVYEPATVITIGVFDNNQITYGGNGSNKGDGKIGKIRVRISTLESGRIYTNSYPLLVLRPSGVKKMGELHLAIRFSCSSYIQMLVQYWKPLLPKMHYARPLKVVQQEILRQHAVNLVAARLSRAEPPLRKEVVEYISDSNSHFWSMRKSRANLFRLSSVFSCLLGTGEWFQDICRWKKPLASTAIHVVYFVLVCSPEMILPVMCFCLFMVAVWNYRLRPRQPPHMDTRISFADSIHPEELNEEFDTFPYSSQDPGVVKMRYERLRSIASRAQTVVGDIAGQGERVHALLSWRDPRATSMFMVLCFVSSVVLYVVPFKVFVLLTGLYIMRHPRFRGKTPPGLVNFFRRLPAKTDCML